MGRRKDGVARASGDRGDAGDGGEAGQLVGRGRIARGGVIGWWSGAGRGSSARNRGDKIKGKEIVGDILITKS